MCTMGLNSEYVGLSCNIMLSMVGLELMIVERLKMNLLLLTMNETIIFGFMIPNEDKATLQPT